MIGNCGAVGASQPAQKDFRLSLGAEGTFRVRRKSVKELGNAIIVVLKNFNEIFHRGRTEKAARL